VRGAFAVTLGILLGSNGIWMLVAPGHWYLHIPGVVATGPANLHFIRDIGCVYVVVGACLVWLAADPKRSWPAAFACGVFLALHALVHVLDTAAGREHPHALIQDFPGVVLPAILVLWLAWPPHHAARKES
jgi:uncharacterized protein YjeT (DUF2065 family)